MGRVSSDMMQLPFFFLMKFLGLLRVSPEEEHEGLDISHHGGSAYPKDMIRMEKGAVGDPSTRYGILTSV